MSEMLTAIQERVQLGIQYLQDKNCHYSSHFVLEKLEEVAKCKVADTKSPGNVLALLEKRKPCLILSHCDVSTFVPKQEVYLIDIHALGAIKEVFDDQNMCIVEITAVGLDDKDERIPLTDILHWNQLRTVKRHWDQVSSFDKKAILTGCLGADTAVAVYKGTFLPHDYASDTNSILNPDLVNMLCDDKAFYQK